MGKTNDELIIFPDLFYVIGADLSLRRPGFAILKIENGVIVDLKTESVDNKKSNDDKTKGQILLEMYEKITEFCSSQKDNVYFVREASINNASFGRRSGTAARIGVSEVIGISDLALWVSKQESWYEIYPTSIKKLITGYGKATKEDVANGLKYYVGEQEYANDDESDATAVAISFLIKNKLMETVDQREQIKK